MKVIDSSRLLAEMQRLSSVAAGSSQQTQSVSSDHSGFREVLSKALSEVNQTQLQASAMAEAVVRGDPNVTLAEAMIQTQKANVAFEATVQVRNRLIQAYQDIMNMPI
ncbi:MAG: flagellar hook-basal body complex protein FliE [Gammaproteobacteria bacterium]|nr:MAG: flagellar hook-basal body complex protein FliE [Gammaproteobacteria bacterium]